MIGRGNLQHGKYINQGPTRGVKPVADIYIYIKSLFFFKQEIDSCNYGGWLSKSEVSRTDKQKRKIPSS